MHKVEITVMAFTATIDTYEAWITKENHQKTPKPKGDNPDSSANRSRASAAPLEEVQLQSYTPALNAIKLIYGNATQVLSLFVLGFSFCNEWGFP